MTTEAILSIPGISCGHCVTRVENATRDLPGVLQVQADAASKSAAFTLETEDTLASVREALEEIGYPAE
jgi:copper chaperone CopZ